MMNGKLPNKAINPKTPSDQKSQGIFSTPRYLRQIFEKFPLITYPTNPLPQRSPKLYQKHVLYIFQSDIKSSEQNLSVNPTCLRWQAFLKFNNIDFDTFSSNNHASPTGSLPFLIPANSRNDRPVTPVSANKISKWVKIQRQQEDNDNEEEEDESYPQKDIYQSLLDNTIRKAWVYYLYLEEKNFRNVAFPMYIMTTSFNYTVQKSLAYQLQKAARDELLSTNVIDKENLYSAANDAFQSLSTLLGENDYFFGHENPGLFDSMIFSYSQILLDVKIPWEVTNLTDDLRKYTNLVSHQERISRKFF